MRMAFWPGVDDGGGRRDRTDDLLLAKQALSQLSYSPKFFWTEVIIINTQASECP